MFTIFSEMSTGQAMVSAFISGVTIMVFGGAAWHGITSAIKRYNAANKTMAVRNKRRV